MNYYISVHNCCVNDNKLWFVARNFNGLFEFDLNNKEFNYIDSFLFEKKYVENLFIGIEKEETTIFFFPSAASYIYSYDIKKKIFQSYDIPEEIKNNKYKFDICYRYFSHVWLISFHNKYIVKFDINERRIIEMIENIDFNVNNNEFITINNNKLWWIEKKDANHIFEYNLQKYKMKKYSINSDYILKCELLYVNDNYIFLFSENILYMIDYRNNMSCVNNVNFKFEKDEMFMGCCEIDGSLWIKTNINIFILSLENFKTTKVNMKAQKDNYTDGVLGGIGLGEIKKIKDYYYLVPGDIQNMLKIKNGEVIEEIPFCIETDFAIDFINKDFLMEYNPINLEFFIKYITQMDIK